MNTYHTPSDVKSKIVRIGQLFVYSSSDNIYKTNTWFPVIYIITIFVQVIIANNMNIKWYNVSYSSSH